MRLISKGDAGVEVFRWNTKASRAPTPGDPLVLYSHPFSLVNPEMFWGSLGSGVVANLIPKTDREREKMREREAIRVQPLEFSLVVPAELVAVALDRAGLGGMTEHSLGASLTPVAPANLAAAAQVERKGHPRLHAPPVPDLFRTMCPMVTVSSARGGTTWASGVLVVGREPATEVYNYMPRGQSNSTESLGPRKAYILTNAHVLLPHLPTNPRGHNRSVGPKLAANAPPPVETNMVKPRDWELGTVRCGARIWLPDGDKGRIRDEQFLHPIFIAPPSSLWDLAVLGPVYLGEDVERMLEWTEAAGNSTGRGLGELVEGCEAAAIGHGVFGPRSDLAPTVSRGILRRVVRIPTEPAALPIQLHSNAAVHNGSSGGPLLALDGGRWKWAGLVCSNLSFTPPGQAAPGGRKFPVKMPSVNFSVPIAVIEPLLKGLFSGDGGAAFARLCSPSALHEPSFSPELELLLDEKHSHFVRSVWSIGFSRMPEEDGEIGRRRKRVRELVEARKRWAEEQERKVDPDQGKPKAKL
ncbi:hypothetical protein DFJ74DRAFT_763321 [Hyaloraphidium curvatum]|nr:hypothetical protein DFJ74DRAFT_763321 [Hyaloraphidium curvatum]